MITIERTIRIRRVPPRRRTTAAAESPAPTEPGRIPRISRLMALAIRFDCLLREGVVADQSALARLAHVTQPRMTQILNLLHLAPDIQEQLLFLPRVTEGKDPVTERNLRSVAAVTAWAEQRESWCRLSRRLLSARS